jgi:hypothetical protein
MEFKVVEITGGTGHLLFSVSKAGALVVKNPLNYELSMGSPYTLMVRVTDVPGKGTGQPLSDTKAFNIYVTDENDPPQFESGTGYSFTVYENHVVGSLVGSVLVQDEDRNGTAVRDALTLSLSGEDSLYLRVGEQNPRSSGREFELVLWKELNFEVKPVMKVILTASDGMQSTRYRVWFVSVLSV